MKGDLTTGEFYVLQRLAKGDKVLQSTSPAVLGALVGKRMIVISRSRSARGVYLTEAGWRAVERTPEIHYEYAGWTYRIWQVGKHWVAEPYPGGQHANAYKEKHRRAAIEEWQAEGQPGLIEVMRARRANEQRTDDKGPNVQ